MGQHLPLTPTALNVEDAVEDLPKIHSNGVSEPFRMRQQGLQDGPFLVT